VADTDLSVGVLVDVSNLATGTSQVSAAVDQMAAKIKTAFGSVEKAPEGVQNALKVMQNSATQSAEVVAAAAGAIAAALNEIPPAAGAAGSAIDSAMTTAGARILNTELGLGRVGLALTRVGIAAGVLGPLITAAFPLLVVTAFVSIIDNVISKIEEMQDRAVDMDLAWQKIDHTILTFGDHLSKELDETDRKIAEVTGHSLTQFDNKIKETSVDADLLFQHINRVLTEFEDEAKKSDRGFLAQFITGKGGVREVIEEAKKAQESIQGALNKDDITGAMDATSKALDDITLRERELKSISGSEDRIASYEKLKTILEAYNVDLQRSVELAKDRTDLSVVETAAAAIREFDRGAKEDSRKSAEEELTAFDRMMELEKKGEEDLKRF
jgi:hypothetical protein